ncbi:MAG TPA: hypothetical protein VNO51_22200 [Ilumatobacteraceae bacterium]|nr:hypothetical protein [Ilumatobacteraceae bacterium]
MTDDLTLLASTYLDGEATPDERARVEADAALLAEVERLRKVRATMLDARWFERPGDDAREAAVAAAVAAWDAPEAGLAGTRTERSEPAAHRPPVVQFERRRSYTRWLTAAAAVAAVAGLGVVVAQSGGGGGDDDQSSTAFEAPTEITASPGAGTELAERSAPPADTEELSTEAAADEAGGEGTDAGVLSDVPTAAGTEAPDATTPALDSAQPVPAADLQTSQQLASFAAEAKAANDQDDTRGVIARPCPDDTFDDVDSYVATGTYRGRAVVIGIDDDVERVIAVDPDTCEIVAEASLP